MTEKVAPGVNGQGVIVNALESRLERNGGDKGSWGPDIDIDIDAPEGQAAVWKNVVGYIYPVRNSARVAA